MKISVGLLLAALACADHVHAVEVDDTISASSASIVVGPASIANIVCKGIVTCESPYTPVCTTNGLTFANPCEFENKYCEKPRDSFYIAAVGPCSEEVIRTASVEDDDEEESGVAKEVLDVPIDIDDVSNPTLNDGGNLESPVIDDPSTEEAATANSEGTNGISSSSGSTGDTTNHSYSDSENGETAEPTADGEASIDCSSGDLTCDMPDAPVCASNGFTYINECQFNNAYCESPGAGLSIVYRRPCDSTEVPMHEQSVSEEEREIWGTVFDVPVELDAHATIAQPSEVDCDGHIKCGKEHAPVCDSTGRTFRNDCEFKNAFCENPGAGLYIASKGECPPTIKSQATQDDGVSADVFDVPVELDEVAVGADVKNDAYRSRQKPSPYCTLACPTGNVLVAPICGTDSRSYINDCHLLSTKCEQPDLEKQYDGLCVLGQPPSFATPSRRSAATGDSSISTQEASRPKCNAFCGKNYAPVCGSNGVTYGNQCLMDFAACQNARITKLSDGKCSEINSASGGTGHAPHSQVACVPAVCPSTEAYVCGSDGQTYLNVCMLNNAKCHIPGLSVAHDGECGAETVLTCGTLTCPRYSECRHDPATQVAYCAEVCHADRCGPNEVCKLRDADCFTAPCSPVATCVAKGNNSGNDH